LEALSQIGLCLRDREVKSWGGGEYYIGFSYTIEMLGLITKVWNWYGTGTELKRRSHTPYKKKVSGLKANYLH